MLPMCLAAAIGGGFLAEGAAALCTFSPLPESPGLVVPVPPPPTQLGVLGFQVGNPLVTGVVHDPGSVHETAEPGKRTCLTVTFYGGEDYVLQIDSRTRFVPSWGDLMCQELARCNASEAARSLPRPGIPQPAGVPLRA